MKCRYLIPVHDPRLADKCSHPKRQHDFYPICSKDLCPFPEKWK